ncbi:MAG: Bug family tripartite tricarboxylate transporter substrate binding protein [Usitatibacter sp.]
MKQFVAIAVAAGLAFACPALAQEWPRKPVRIIVPFAPASSPDMFARVLADALTKRLNQPFIVDNKPGAGGMIGTDAVAKAAPDGGTIGVSITGPLVNNTLLYKTMAYDPFRDIAPITLAVNQPCILVANNDFNATDLPSVLAELKRNPGKYNYASLGNGTMAHLAMELVAARSGTQVVQVPYPGSGQAVQALLAGDASLGCMPAITVLSLINGGRLKAIGVAAQKRSSLLPEMRTLGEQGLEGVEANSWIGVIAPGKTPSAMVERMSREIAATLRQPEVAKALHAQLMEPVGNTPQEFAAFMREELQRWGPIIKHNHITLD